MKKCTGNAKSPYEFNINNFNKYYKKLNLDWDVKHDYFT